MRRPWRVWVCGRYAPDASRGWAVFSLRGDDLGGPQLLSESIAVGVRRSASLRSGEEWSRLVGRIEAEMEGIYTGGAGVRTQVQHSSALVTCGGFTSGSGQDAEHGVDVIPTTATVLTRQGRRVSAHDLLATAGPDSIVGALRDVVPPFGCIMRDRATEEILAAVDLLGMRHLYFAVGPGCSIVGSSATFLARFLGSPIDVASAAVFSRLGHFLGERTMFTGIRKIARGEVIRLTEGGAEVGSTSADLPQVVRRSGHFRTLAEATSAGTEVVGGAVARAGSAFPEAVLELSGGLDSRLILAGLGRSARPERRTLTIGPETSDDMRVARGLVAAYGLDGAFVPFSHVDAWNATEVATRVSAAAAARDYSSNPMAGSIYDFVSERIPAAAQITGAAGEQARGRYFAGQRRHPEASPDRVESVVRWQLALNQSVDTSVLDPSFVAGSAAELRVQAWQLVEGVDGEWPQATDQIYMFGRMQRWAGPAYSHWGLERHVVAPFFHPDYVDWASRLPLAAKRTSSAFLDVLAVLDRGLFDRPLANGLTPRQMRSATVLGRIQRRRRDAHRLARKARQRIANRRHVPAGVGSLSHLMAEVLRREPPVTLASVDFLDQEGIDRFLSGARELDPVSISFLINVAGAAGLSER